MKKIISILLAIIMSVSLLPDVVLAEHGTEGVSLNEYSGNVSVSDSGVDTFSETTLIDSPKQTDYVIKSVDLSETKVIINYETIKDCDIFVRFLNEETGEQFAEKEQFVYADAGTVEIDISSVVLPKYYLIEVCLSDGGKDLSEPFYNDIKTAEYEKFLNQTSHDKEFDGLEILHYGNSSDGKENFAVISDDVKVVHVDSMSEIKMTDAEGDSVDALSLMSIDSEEVETFSFEAEDKDCELYTELEEIEAGDKVIIVPADDIQNAASLKVESKDEISLMGAEDEVVLIADLDDELDTEDLFEFVRIDMEIDVTEEDIEDSDEIKELNPADDEVELFGFFYDGGEKKLSATWEDGKKIYDKNGIEVVDSIKLTGIVCVKIYFKKVKTSKWKPAKWVIGDNTEVYAEVVITNTLIFDAKSTSKCEESIKIGSIYSKSLFFKKVVVDVPVNIDFGLQLYTHLNATCVQTTGAKVGFKYGGSYVNKYFTRKPFSNTWTNISAEGKITVTAGPSIALEGVVKKKLEARVKGYLHIIAEGVTKKEKADTVKHECDFCLDCTLNGKLGASGKLWFNDTEYFNGNLGRELSFHIKDFYVSYDKSRNPKWKVGDGDCSNKSYKVVITTKNKKNGKVLSGATVKYGNSTLGKSNNKGKVSGWFKTGTYNFKATKSKYNSASAKKYVGTSGLNLTLSLSPKSGANEEYYVIDDIFDLTDDEYDEFIADTEYVENCMFCIETASDLEKLAELVNDTNRNTEPLRFVLNNSEGTIDLSGIDWTPIGTESRPFMSEFDGNRMTITGLDVNSNSDYQGLFGNVENAEIFDLGITGATVNGNDYVGIMAGNISGETKIYDIYVTGSVSGNGNVGALSGAADKVDILNSYSTADVAGAFNVGGLVGIFNHSVYRGQVTNSYSVGEVNGSSETGGIAGMVTFENVAIAEETSGDSEEIIEDIPIVGIQYCYYLDDSAPSAIGTQRENTTVIAYPVSFEQATGHGATEMISSESEIANSYTLLDSLNKWYNIFSSNSAEANESDDPSNLEDTTTEDEDETTITLQVADPYNKWFEDKSNTNSGYPLFEEKGPVYELRVEYEYEDGTMAHNPVVLYLTEGQAYDVDSYSIDGYFTDEIEYTGVMPANDVVLKVIYFKENNAPRVYDMYNTYLENGTEAKEGETYIVVDVDDLVALSNYVNSGGNTKNVILSISDTIDLSGVDFTPIGTAQNSFEGVVNGNMNIISNFTLNASADCVGLFAYTNNALFKELSIMSFDVTGVENVGALIGNANNTSLDSLIIEASVSGENNVGGVVGYAENSQFINVVNSGSVTGVDCIGGIVGKQVESDVINSANSMTITSEGKNTGGISGETNSSYIINSYSVASIKGGSVVGGITGKSTDSRIENVYNMGGVFGSDVVAALAGEIDNQIYNGYYLNSDVAVAKGSSTGTNKFDSSDLEGLCLLLNNWVNSKGMNAYYTWYYDSESYEYPVLDAEYDNWILNFSLDNNLEFTYNAEFLSSNSILYVGTYDKNGRLITCYVYTESETYTLPVSSDVTCAKAFVWDDNLMPLDVNVERKAQ